MDELELGEDLREGFWWRNGATWLDIEDELA